MAFNTTTINEELYFDVSTFASAANYRAADTCVANKHLSTCGTE